MSVTKQNQNITELKFFDSEMSTHEISTLLSLTPTAYWTKGDEFLFGNKRKNIKQLRENNYWEYRLETWSNDFIGNQIALFFDNIIVPKISSIRQITNQCHAEFSVVQFIHDGYNPGFCLDKKQIEMLFKAGLKLSIDLNVLTTPEND